MRLLASCAVKFAQNDSNADDVMSKTFPIFSAKMVKFQLSRAAPRQQALLQGASAHALQEDLDAHWGGYSPRSSASSNRLALVLLLRWPSPLASAFRSLFHVWRAYCLARVSLVVLPPLNPGC